MMGGFELVLRELGSLPERGDDCSASEGKEGQHEEGPSGRKDSRAWKKVLVAGSHGIRGNSKK